MDYRDKGIKSLKKVLKTDSNIKIIEELIYKTYKSKYESENESKYNEILYQIIGDIISVKDNNINLKTIAQNIKEGKIGFNHQSYDDIRLIIKEQDDYLICPFEVEEGVMECNKCGSNKVITYSKQTRAGDEGTTVFCTCSNAKCGNRWKV
jgi:DNA-directed RNA polymerase subunit M/transcription elongation factor TFIIS